jgi:ABC-type transport system involved in cytochrome bd biosynthesis fused ATPase/permease subunit
VETEHAIMTGIRRQFPELLVVVVSHRDSLRKFADTTLDFDSYAIVAADFRTSVAADG